MSDQLPVLGAIVYWVGGTILIFNVFATEQKAGIDSKIFSPGSWLLLAWAIVGFFLFPDWGD